MADQPAAASAYTEGQLKNVDTDQSKISIKHGPIDNLGMPGMTMVVRADAAVLAKFKAGDLVRFKADRVDGSQKVTEMLGRSSGWKRHSLCGRRCHVSFIKFV